MCIHLFPIDIDPSPILHSDSPRVVQNSLWTLRNLSDAAVREVGLNSLLETLVQFLNNQDIAVLQCAAGILSNLTCNNTENKRIVWEANGVSLLVATMSRGGHEREDLTEPSVCALRHLTSRHQDAEQARSDIVNRNALPILANLLQVSRVPLRVVEGRQTFSGGANPLQGSERTIRPPSQSPLPRKSRHRPPPEHGPLRRQPKLPPRIPNY